MIKIYNLERRHLWKYLYTFSLHVQNEFKLSRVMLIEISFITEFNCLSKLLTRPETR